MSLTFAQAQYAHDHASPDDDLPECPDWVAESLTANAAFVDQALSDSIDRLVAGFLAGDTANLMREIVAEYVEHIWLTEGCNAQEIVRSWDAFNAKRDGIRASLGFAA